MASEFTALAGRQYMQLVTFRKSGAAVATPVWFAEQGGRLYVMSVADAGKVKRARASDRAQVGPCDARGRPQGELVDARVRVLPPERGPQIEALLNSKYGWVKRLFDLFAPLSGRSRRAYLEIMPPGAQP